VLFVSLHNILNIKYRSAHGSIGCGREDKPISAGDARNSVRDWDFWMNGWCSYSECQDSLSFTLLSCG
jgi:hypothetical protein